MAKSTTLTHPSGESGSRFTNRTKRVSAQGLSGLQTVPADPAYPSGACFPLNVGKLPCCVACFHQEFY